MIDRNKHVPLYIQLKEDLIEKIKSGIWGVECQIPTEKLLMEENGVGRVTVREALSLLVNEGYLYKNDFVIFDEAHTLETVASEHIIPAISREMIKYHLLRLYNSRKKRGFLLSFPLLHIIPIIQNLLDLNQYFFQEIKREKEVQTVSA